MLFRSLHLALRSTCSRCSSPPPPWCPPRARPSRAAASRWATRRFALGAAALAAGPLAANADVASIAAAANAKAAKEREEALYGPPPEPELDSGEKLKPILLVAGGGLALSIPFYFQNLQRLGTKVASGGKDSGYAQSKKLVDAKGDSAGKAAKSFFFKQ